MRASPRIALTCAALLLTGAAVRARSAGAAEPQGANPAERPTLAVAAAADPAASADLTASADPAASADPPASADPAAPRAGGSVRPAPAPVTGEVPPESTTPLPQEKLLWLDDVHDFVYNAVWRSAMRMDRLFGSEEPDVSYEQASGSIAPALLYDRHGGFRPQLRFIGNVPLPQLSQSFHAFIGRLNPQEFISESQPASGALPNPYAQYREDETLLGIQYYQPQRQGAQWDAGAGMPVTLSRFDPYLKGGYIYQLGEPEHGVMEWRQDLFYQDSQGGFGVTTRLDMQRLVSEGLLLDWAASTTYAQRSYGWRSYSTLDAYWAFPNRRALVAELEVDGATQAAVPLHDYGWKLAYRRSILRDWLVLEVRTSLDWPKDYPQQPREPSWGLGVAFEMMFGTDVFLARPITF